MTKLADSQDAPIRFLKPRDPEKDASCINPAKGRVCSPTQDTDEEDTQACELRANPGEGIDEAHEPAPESAPSDETAVIAIVPLTNPHVEFEESPSNP